MTQAAERRPLTLDEYRALERASLEAKHEFVAGEIYSMAGAKRAHNRVAANVVALLNNAFADRPCEVYGSDMRVMTRDATGCYPDVSATCGEPLFTDAVEDELTNPMLIVEVLSESTKAYDRGEKFEHYQTVPTLREYVLVDPTRQHVDVYFREADHWQLRSYGAGATVPLRSVEVDLPMTAIYDKVKLG